MTDRNDLRALKNLAKRYARANRIPHHQALDLVAAELGFPHWKAVANAAKDSWRASPVQLAGVEAFVSKMAPALQGFTTEQQMITAAFGDDEPVEEGNIGPDPYWVEEALGDVYIFGKGWHIQVGEAPSAKPVVEVTDKRYKSNPVRDPEFAEEALKIAQARTEKVRARISSDWPRRSTKPDAGGRARHPLWGDLSKEWFCLHCDGQFTGPDMAGNMWHCPKCSATPIDIFSSPFWLAAAAE